MSRRGVSSRNCKQIHPVKMNRRIAVKTVIREILSADYLQEEENNYLLTQNQQKIYRFNLVAIILEKEKRGNITNFLLDDGTDIIILRFFEDNKNVHQLNVGDALMIIGKLRIYNQEKYISPEIVKKIDPRWLRIRAKEMEHLKSGLLKEKEEKNPETFSHREEFEIEEIMVKEDDQSLPNQKIFQIIKELDLGGGVSIEEIIHKSPLKDTILIIQKMLEKGDIFQNSPGKVKIL